MKFTTLIFKDCSGNNFGCRKLIINNINIVDQKKIIKKNNKIYCNQCGYTTTDSKLLKEHLELTHNLVCTNSILQEDCVNIDKKKLNIFKDSYKDEPIYHCDLCNYITKRYSDLERHRKIHFNPDLKCKYCNYTCNRKDNLKRHYRDIHL